MAIAKVEVLQAIRIPAGSVLDGVTLQEGTWVSDGVHEVDLDLVNEKMWATYGSVALLEVDGQPYSQGACCGGH